MEKITLKALQLAGFQNADMISKIISYVPNPQVAVEMLLGLYEPTVIEAETRFRKHRYNSQEEIVEITNVDDLGSIVYYNVYVQKTKYVYYLTREDKENNVYVTERPKDYYTSGSVKTTGYTVEERSKDIKNFYEDYTKTISVADTHTILNEWDMYGIPQYTLEEKEFNPYDLMP